jgi:hypothetical protein
MTKPNNFDKYLTETPEVEKREYLGKTYLVDLKTASMLAIGSSVMRLDDRTLVVGSTENAMRMYIQLQSSKSPGLLGRPAFIEAEQWKAFEGDLAVAAVKAKTVEEAIKMGGWLSRPPLPAFFAPFSPLWQEGSWGIAGVHVGDEVKVHAIAVAKSGEAAEKVERTVEAARALALNTVEAFRKQRPATPAGPPLATAELNVVAGVLASLRTDREGPLVRLQGSVTSASVREKLPSILTLRDAARKRTSINNLKQLALAMHNYHDAKGHFPPAVLYGPDGKTPHSWRVALLPYMEYSALYKEYRFDEPWDGPNNRKLAVVSLPEFSDPSQRGRSANTSYFALVGPGTIFEERDQPPALMRIPDGTARTIMLVEAKRDIPWTKPEDIPYDPDKPLPKLGGYFEDGFHVALADGSVRFLPSTVSEKILRALITRAGGEDVRIEDALPTEPSAGSSLRDRRLREVEDKLRKQPPASPAPVPGR